MGCCIGSEAAVEILKDETTTTPVRTKKCTDVTFLFLYVVSVVAIEILVLQYGIVAGNPERYIYGVDSWGNICGRKDNAKVHRTSNGSDFLIQNSGLDKTSYTFELNFALSDLRRFSGAAVGFVNQSSGALCVESCPGDIASCEDLVRENGYNVNPDILTRRICPVSGVVVPHVAILNRCVPQQLSALGKGLEQALFAAAGAVTTNGSASNDSAQIRSTVDFAQRSIQAVAENATTLTYLLLIAVGASFLVIIILQLFARVLVIALIIIAAFGTGAATAWLWYSYGVSTGDIPADAAMNAWRSLLSSGNEILGIEANATSPVSSASAKLSEVLMLQKINQSEFLLPIAIGATIFTLISWILLIWTRKSLWLTVRLFDEASLAIFSNPSILLQPLHTTLWLSATLVAFLIGTAFLLSDQVFCLVYRTIASADADGIIAYVDRPFAESGRIRFIFFVFVFLWTFEFIFGCQEVILAGAISTWFFRQGKDKKCRCTAPKALCTPFVQLLKYNLGSVALGSLIVAIVRFIRLILAYLQKKLKNSDHKAAKFMLTCLQCCLGCFEKVLKYVNRNAYICIAMYGEGFCPSARRALGLLISNAQHVLALNCVSGFCLFLGKIMVVAAASAVGWIWIPGSDVTDVGFYVPMIICCVGAYFIASCFMSVFSIAIDTIFLCFCDDMQRNDGGERPYYSSKRLRSILSGGGNKKTINAKGIDGKAPEEIEVQEIKGSNA